MSNDSHADDKGVFSEYLGMYLPDVLPVVGNTLDHLFETSHGGRLFGALGLAIDAYRRTVDDEGFTIKDGFAIGGGIGAGIATGAAIGALGGNPFTAFLGGATGGALAAFGIDSVPYLTSPNAPVFNKYTV